MTAIELVAAVGAFVSALLFAAGLASIGRARRQRYRSRLERAHGDVDPELVIRAQVRRQGPKASRWELLAVRLMPRRDNLARKLVQAGSKLSVARFAAICLVMSLGAGLAIWVMLGLPPMFSLGLGVAAGILLPRLWLGWMIKRRRRRFLMLFPDALDQIIRGVRSGIPVGESFASIGRDMPSPIGDEFQAVVDGMRLGRTLEDAMWHVAERLDLPEFNFLVICMSVQRETGGNLAETLENLGEIIRKRYQMQQKARAMASEARASALIVGSLPFVLGGVLYLVDAEYMGRLFTDPRGLILLALALLSEVTGFLVMSRMSRIDV